VNYLGNIYCNYAGRNIRDLFAIKVQLTYNYAGTVIIAYYVLKAA
jgi:hypothetical protein